MPTAAPAAAAPPTGTRVRLLLSRRTVSLWLRFLWVAGDAMIIIMMRAVRLVLAMEPLLLAPPSLRRAIGLWAAPASRPDPHPAQRYSCK
jgi:hypothetical protein